jgi:hypothetical protein
MPSPPPLLPSESLASTEMRPAIGLCQTAVTGLTGPGWRATRSAGTCSVPSFTLVPADVTTSIICSSPAMRVVAMPSFTERRRRGSSDVPSPRGGCSTADRNT